MEGDCVLIVESVGKILRWNHPNETSQVLSHGIFPFFFFYYIIKLNFGILLNFDYGYFGDRREGRERGEV